MEGSDHTAPTVVCVAEAGDEGARADVVLGRHIAQLSRRVARKLALEGRLRIDGAPAKPSARVRSGQRLELRLPTETGEPPPLRVLAQTPELVYVHKPPGVHSVALHPGERHCLASLVVAAFPECEGASDDPREGGALHRLDRPTSGVMAFARSREVWDAGRAAFSEGTPVKDYLARSGAPWPPRLPEGALITWLDEVDAIPLPPGLRSETPDAPTHRVRAALGPAESRGRMRVRMDGQRATTWISLLARLPDGGCLMRLRLDTGHRHQARVHLAWAGLPLWGDTRYDGAPAPRLGLHAYALDLRETFPDHPHVVDPSGLAAWLGAEQILSE